ncbi:unnamed protein product [Prorocentrum cordatum]|uniref:Uncharacterized protein n=1 Tax=Prorocentrum cordatum TaxID=2364126 RepID=A0ABN9PL52_9DINO|nr:unnamed protein product [Polarella glacialis]
MATAWEVLLMLGLTSWVLMTDVVCAPHLEVLLMEVILGTFLALEIHGRRLLHCPLPRRRERDARSEKMLPQTIVGGFRFLPPQLSNSRRSRWSSCPLLSALLLFSYAVHCATRKLSIDYPIQSLANGLLLVMTFARLLVLDASFSMIASRRYTCWLQRAGEQRWQEHPLALCWGFFIGRPPVGPRSRWLRIQAT